VLQNYKEADFSGTFGVALKITLANGTL